MSYDAMEFRIDGEVLKPEPVNDPHRHTYVATMPPPTNRSIHRVNLRIGGSSYSFTLDVDSYRREHTFLEQRNVMSTIFTDENCLIDLWCDYHSKVGFGHFFLYNNRPSNRLEYYDLMEKYKGRVSFIDWATPYRNAESGISGQTTQQNHSIWRFSSVNFLALTDLDEYIVPDAIDLLDPRVLRNHCGLSLECYRFGCNRGVRYTEQDFIYRLTRRQSEIGADGAIVRRDTKCLVNPQQVDMFSVHKVLRSTKPVKLVEPREARINHYYPISSKRRRCDCSNMDAIADPRIIDLARSHPSELLSRRSF